MQSEKAVAGENKNALRKEQLITTLQQAAIKAKRAEIVNPADELMWLNFETKMRGVIRELVTPVIDMSQRDREGMLILEEGHNLQEDRLEKLEEAVFNIAKHGKETLFQKMARRIKENESKMTN